MKKKKNRILSVSGAALCLFFPILLAACSQEDALPRPLEVSAEVGSPATRAAADSHADDYDKSEFVAGDVIRITDGTKTADYQRVVTGTTGTWQPASGQTALTTTGSETFTASYPTAFTRILTDQRTATNFWKSNRLTATGVLDGNKATFSFAPEAAKVTLVVKYGNNDRSFPARQAWRVRGLPPVPLNRRRSTPIAPRQRELPLSSIRMWPLSSPAPERL